VKYFIPLVFAASALYAQIGFVEYNHPVLPFLERMKTMNVIEDFDPFEFPKTRSEIVRHLIKIDSSNYNLSLIDRKILNDFLTEFAFDIDGDESKYSSIFSKNKNHEHLSQKEKFVYFDADSSRFNVFAKFLFNYDYIYEDNRVEDSIRTVSLFRYGGKIRGSFLNNFGYSIQGTNGTYSGNKSLAQEKGDLRYNYKFHLSDESTSGKDYFDDTEGYLMTEFDFFNLRLGRDRINIGYGPVKYILSNNPPKMDHVSLNFKYGIFSFSYIHGKLLGNTTVTQDSVEGSLSEVTEKYIAYHRFNFEFSRHITLGIGEIAVYSRRSIDLSYLNPFNFYKSVEHSNQDRDNSLLFFDLKNNSIDGLSFYSTFMMDDIDFGKLGTDWYGNNFLLNLGLQAAPFANILPLVLDVQYLRLDPYFYTHRINGNNYTHLNFNIGPEMHPNSQSIFAQVTFFPHHRLELQLNYQYSEHGANVLDDNGNVIINYGGDIDVGYRKGDPTEVKFLDGIFEVSRIFKANITYEPVLNYYFRLAFLYKREDLAFGKNDLIESTFSIFVSI
jgi:hypothetical protein